MTTKEILAELKIYLPASNVIELDMNGVLTGQNAICACMTVTKIIQTYNSTPENENTVSLLLVAFCKNHFQAMNSQKKIAS